MDGPDNKIKEYSSSVQEWIDFDKISLFNCARPNSTSEIQILIPCQ